ncbi:MAG: NUDIX hydrolase [Cyanobacteria bacterium P01_D01_bin.128]
MSKKPKIRAIAICLFRNGDRILANQGYNRSAQRHFCRPLGGGIDFGETSEAAVIREIQEELGAELVRPKFLGVLESIFVYNDAPGHELVFVYDGQFADAALYNQPVIRAVEGDRTFEARWYALEDLKSGEIRLVPEGLWTLL